ncbi:MAG TPA: hypothetical protein VFX05_03530, partial [Casimicrobiaceae bacterium]|nr:hypothetical protein [Casimicrobiaceae bacterium]
MSGVVLVVASAAIAAAVVALLRRVTDRLPHAHPGARTLHDRPVPRVGGLAILAGALPALVADPPVLPGGGAPWLAGGAAIALVSLA